MCQNESSKCAHKLTNMTKSLARKFDPIQCLHMQSIAFPSPFVIPFAHVFVTRPCNWKTVEGKLSMKTNSNANLKPLPTPTHLNQRIYVNDFLVALPAFLWLIIHRRSQLIELIAQLLTKQIIKEELFPH